MRIGYACINTELRQRDIWTSRSLRKKTYEEKGLEYVSELIEQNVSDLIKILQWNDKHNIRFFRMSSSIFPFIDWYQFEDLPNFDKIKSLLDKAGSIAKNTDQRVTQHPDHFVKIASQDRDLIQESLSTLESQSRVFDLMGFEKSPYHSINIHVGGAYGNKEKTLKRFRESYKSMSDSLQSRLTVENDDRQALFTIQDLKDGLHDVIDIPLVFDSLHFSCHKGGFEYKDALFEALSTWPEDITPVVHHSNSKQLFEDDSASLRGHTDYCFTKFYNFGKNVDIMIEAKEKEKARNRYIKKFS